MRAESWVLAMGLVAGACTALTDAALEDKPSVGDTMSTTTTQSGGGGSGGGGAPCGTDEGSCLDGLDDDCDDLIDCADPDCVDYTCATFPRGSRPVKPVAAPGDCEGELTVLDVADCSACGCTPDDVGTCTHEVLLYDNAACAGAPIDQQVVPTGADACDETPATAAGASETIGASAIALGLGDASCSADGATAPAASAYFCAAQPGGGCEGDQVCVPDAGLSCALLAGDVACPSPFDQKTLVRERNGATTCDCDCASGTQTCPTDDHVHAFVGAGCTGTKFDVQPGGCVDTLLVTVESVNNHSAVIAATAAQCANVSTPSVASPVQTLCCPR
jgi:hypothetical protein